MNSETPIPPAVARHGQATLVELSVTLAHAFDSPVGAAPLSAGFLGQDAALDPARLRSASNVVLILLDGAGRAAIERHVGSGVIAAGRRALLDSVFPSSTAPAITSLVSGLAPTVHGNSGWFLWSETHGRVLRSLPMDWRASHGEPVSDWRWSWQGWFGSPGLDSVAIQPVEIHDSAFSRHAFAGARLLGYRDLDDFVLQTVTAARERERGRRLIYAYAPHFDACCHDHGWQSDAAGACLRALDRAVDDVLAGLEGSDTVVLVTADHGFCDVAPERQFDIAQFPGLADHLRAPLTGEPRVAFCHLKPGHEADFIALATRELRDIADVHRSRDLLTAGWFGMPAQARMAGAFGDVCLLMRECTAIGDRLPGERAHRMVGMHGGYSAEEMEIALAVYDLAAASR
ncbi:MAG: alkaline phosphatase family protein [Burkholderiaceae bacterium]